MFNVVEFEFGLIEIIFVPVKLNKEVFSMFSSAEIFMMSINFSAVSCNGKLTVSATDNIVNIHNIISKRKRQNYLPFKMFWLW